MKLRTKNNTTIQYILVADGSPIISPILPPDAFKNNVIDFLKNSPKDILQLIDSLDYFEAYMRHLWNYGIDFHVFNIQDYELLKEHIDSSKQVQFFFLNGSLESHIALYNKLQDNNLKIRFYHFYNLPEKFTLKSDFLVKTPGEFIKLLIEKQNNILEYLNLKDVEIHPSVSLEYKNFNKFLYFIPTRLNYFLINNIIGNFSISETSESDEEIIAKHSIESTKANKNKHSFERQNLFIEQIKKIDFYRNICYKEEILKPVNAIEPYLSPLIFVLPFHNPDLKDIYKEKRIIQLLQIEQTENYIHEIETSAHHGLVAAGMEIQRDRIRYLDDISFLHSTFTFSPVIRFPTKGKSIYRELSFFSTKTFPNFSIAKNRRKIKKTIFNFGKSLREKILSPELEKLIKKRNGQIIAITDLPIEWLFVDDIPFSFTHDICRLPETSLHGLMSFFTNNQMFEYSIPTNIIKKTLVILGAHEEPFKKWHPQVYNLSQRDGFKIAECKSLEEVRQAIDKEKPELLIFDCHGGYDEETQSTYLNIGNYRLDGHYIVENNLSAPIVFLSACGTAPTYGTMNPIANAFFEAGAISVTSTFLPISVDSGSILYLRVLNKLSYAANHTIHKNWLEFIGHLIRTSSINDAFLLALSKKREIESADFFTSNVHALTESLIFSKRRNLYETMDKKISSLTNSDRAYYSEVVPEYLLYTNLGRGDLILFDKWKEEFIKKNVC